MERQVFDPGKGFFELPVVRWVVGIGLALFAISAGGFLWSAWEFDRCWSPNCLNYFFINLMKVPLGMLAFTAATLALMATHHRSKQFAHQSTITNYYTHLKEFRVYMDGWKSERVKSYSSSKLYQKFFPSVLYGTADVCENFLGGCEYELSWINGALEKLLEEKQRPQEWYEERTQEIIDGVESFCDLILEDVELDGPRNFFMVTQGLLPIPDGLRSIFGNRLSDLVGAIALIQYVVEFDPYADLRVFNHKKNILEEHMSILRHGRS
ncbi:hypothetical protein [Gilvimarinus agarilyticus]|uniref:hypothetical protein n=1 Tax=Gilvimarinus agarilyticus TaxID=679259 RepID=UPI0005A2A9CF|nr:hypothetical protein [Gilvimarinus agarilyticus]